MIPPTHSTHTHQTKVQFGQAASSGVLAIPITLVRDVFERRETKRQLEAYRTERLHGLQALQTADITLLAETALRNACNELGIPIALHPQLLVYDHPFHMTEEEVQRLIDTRQRERESIDFQITEDELKGLIGEDEEVDPVSVISVPAMNPEHRAEYRPAFHTVAYNARIYRQMLGSPIKTMAHEAWHADQVLLRSILSPDERRKIVQQALLSRILHGEDMPILVDQSANDYADAYRLYSKVAVPPELPQEMRKEFCELLETEIFPYATDWAYILRYGGKYREPAEPTDIAAYEALRAWVGDLVGRHPEFLRQFKGSHEKAVNRLLDHTQMQAFRLERYSRAEIQDPNIIEQAKNCPRYRGRYKQAARSLADSIIMDEGTAGRQYTQYLSSPEEVHARIYAARFEQAQIIQYLKTQSPEGIELLSLRVRLQRLKLEVQVDELIWRYFQVELMMFHNPQNRAIRSLSDQLAAQITKADERLSEITLIV